MHRPRSFYAGTGEVSLLGHVTRKWGHEKTKKTMPRHLGRRKLKKNNSQEVSVKSPFQFCALPPTSCHHKNHSGTLCILDSNVLCLCHSCPLGQQCLWTRYSVVDNSWGPSRISRRNGPGLTPLLPTVWRVCMDVEEPYNERPAEVAQVRCNSCSPDWRGMDVEGSKRNPSQAKSKGQRGGCIQRSGKRTPRRRGTWTDRRQPSP